MHVAIAGAGIGGMTLASLLDRMGHDVTLVEKADAFAEVGAGIQISPNGSRILAAIGLADDLARIGTMPERIVMRRWEDDAELLARPQGHLPIERYGHPYYNVYRPDLVDILAEAVAGVTTRFGAEVVGARNLGGGAALDLADGTVIEADVAVGADGIHSRVRDAVFGASPSRFAGLVAYRALVPRDLVADLSIEVTNRMGPGRHIVSYFVGEGQRHFNLVCVVPEAAWDVEGWNEPGSVEDLRAHFAGWSPAVHRILDLVDEPVYRWALHDRPPMERWVDGRVALLGDSCHAMLPFMAQGACQAIEDGAILSRLLTEAAPDVVVGRCDRVDVALERYRRIRRPRAAEIQTRSWKNATTFHLPDGPEQRRRDRILAAGNVDDGSDPLQWLHGYDALTIDLEPTSAD